MDNGDTPRTRDGPKKKKANRACFHCQKAHLTCDDCECLARSPPAFVCAPSLFCRLEQLAPAAPLKTSRRDRDRVCYGVMFDRTHGLAISPLLRPYNPR